MSPAHAPEVRPPASDEAERLAVLREYDILDTEPERAFDDIVRLARRICAAPIALVSLVDADRQWFKARTGIEATETPLSHSVCAHGVAEHVDLVIPDLATDPRTRDNPLVTGPPHLRFYAGALLEAPGGHALGMLCVIDHAPRPGGLTAAQAEDLVALARQVVAQLELRRSVRTLGTGLVSARAAARLNAARATASEAARARQWEDAARAAAAQDAGGTGAFDTDFATGRIHASEAFGRIFGLPPAAEYPMDAVEERVLPEDRHLLSTRQARNTENALAAVEYRIRRADDGALRWVERRGAFVRDASGHRIRFVGTLFDVTDRKQGELRQAALLALGDRLRTATDTGEIAGVAARILGETLDVSRAGYAALDLAAESCRVERDWTAPGVPSLAGLHGLARFGETVARLRRGEPLAAAQDGPGLGASGLTSPGPITPGPIAPGPIAPGMGAQMTVPLVDGAGLVGLLFVHSDAPRSWSRDEISFAQVVADRAYAALAKIEAERHQTLLNQELSHRLKNTLSMVQAIASQTLRDATDSDALDDFNRRLITLGTAHDLLLQKNWASSTLHAVIDGAISRHAGMDRITVAGPDHAADLTINPRAVLAISMLLHELATNAVKYGALSVGDGSVQVEWTIHHTDAEAGFTLTWTESGGPAVTPPAHNGFGTRLIRAGLTGTGGATLDYRPTGLVATFTAPLSRMV